MGCAKGCGCHLASAEEPPKALEYTVRKTHAEIHLESPGISFVRGEHTKAQSKNFKEARETDFGSSQARLLPSVSHRLHCPTNSWPRPHKWEMCPSQLPRFSRKSQNPELHVGLRHVLKMLRREPSQQSQTAMKHKLFPNAETPPVQSASWNGSAVYRERPGMLSL